MQPLRAITYKLVSVVLFVLMTALLKKSMEEVPTGEAVFFRSFFSLPVVFVWLLWTGHLHDGLRTVKPMAHVWRGVVGCGALSLGMVAYSILPMPEATAILYAGPLLVVVFAAMFLGEEVRLFRILTVLLGMVGVLIVLSPNLIPSDDVQDVRRTLGATVALCSAVLAALAQVFVRNMVRTETTSSIVFYFLVVSSIGGLLTLPFGWVMPRAPVFAMLVAAGILGGIGQVLLTSAYRYGDASLVAPFEYSSMIWSILIGYFVFADFPSDTTLIGGGVLILAGVMIILRERRLGLDRQQQRQARPPEG